MTSTSVFRVFVSSTFSDMAQERNVLHERVYPRLRGLCEEYGARFQPIDLRWGISDDAAYNQQTVEICLAEIERCQQMTRRPNFIVLLGDRYGWQPPPATIPHDEFEIVLAHTSGTPDQDLLNEWYRRDDNAIPPVYCLQPRTGAFTDSATWNPVEHHLRQIMETCTPYLARDCQAKYLTSVTEQEIERGIFTIDDPESSAFCFFRTITALPVHPDARCYIDLDEYDQLDTTAQTRLHNLKQRLRDRFPDNVHEYETRWETGTLTTNHLDQLCEDVYECLSAIIRTQLETRQRYTNPWEEEFSAHFDFGQERARSFVGRAEVTDLIRAYLAQPASQPLIVHGESGSGKTTVMSRVMQQVQADYPQAFLICRFIGVTPGSSDIRSLLESLCRQIVWRTGVSVPIPTDYHELVSTFAALLTEASTERPLIVLLDALDQLSTLNDAHELHWLPIELPDHVHLISSTLPGELLDVLRAKLGTGNLVEVGSMPVAEGRDLLHVWLDEAHRTLQSHQEAEVLRHFEANGNPLYLRLAFEEARLWQSWTPAILLRPNIPGIIRDNLLARLANVATHGPMLVSHALAYLVAARNGLTEDELLDLLTLDDEFWVDFTENAHWKPRNRHVPVVLWSRLYFDLRPYLTEHARDGTTLLAFYHRQLRDIVESCYLGEDTGTAYYRRMADYFEEQSLYLVQNGEQVPNRRKLSELPYQQFHGDMIPNLCKMLTESPEWMDAQFSATLGDAAYLADLDLTARRFEDPLSVNELLDLIRLYAAQQTVHMRVAANEDTDLKTYVWLGRTQEALGYAQLRSEPYHRFKGLMTIYDAQKRRGDVNVALLETAHQAFNDIVDTEDRTDALSTLGIALIDKKDARVNAVIDEIYTTIPHIAEWTQLSSLTALAAALASANDQRAEDILLQVREKAVCILDEKMQVYTLRDLVPVLLRINSLHVPQILDEMYTLAHDFTDKEDHFHALIALGTTLACGNDSRVEEVFAEAYKVAQEIDDRERQSFALNTLTNALSRAGMNEKAELVAHSILDVKSTTSALCAVATSLAQSCDQRAEAVFDEVLRMINSISSNEIRSSVLNTLVVALVESANHLPSVWAMVEYAFTEAYAAAHNVSDKKSLAEALSDLAAGLAWAGAYQRAEMVAHDITEKWERYLALTALVSALVRKEDRNPGNQLIAEKVFVAKQELLNSLTYEGSERGETLYGLSTALAWVGEHERAEKVAQMIADDYLLPYVRRSLDFAKSRSQEGSKVIPSDRPPHISTEDIRTKQWDEKVKQLVEAKQYTEAEKVVSSIADEYERSEAICNLVSTLAQAKEFEQAERIALNTSDEYDQTEALISIAVILARMGEIDRARKVTQNIQDEWRQSETSRNLVSILGGAGWYSRALHALRVADPDDFVTHLAGWSVSMEQLAQGLTLIVLGEVTRILGWGHFEWRKVNELLTQAMD